jgi:hypothetical protein
LPRRAAKRRPYNVILVAIALLVAQLPLQLHLLVVRHTTCEHGELVDAPEARDSRADTSTARQRDGAAHLSSAQDERSGGHHHCDALAVRHRLPEAGPAVASATLSWVELVQMDGERAERRSVPLLSLAPKGSPPVV